MEHFDDLFDLGRLVSGYLKNDLSPEEQLKLDNWLSASADNRTTFQRLTSETKLKADYGTFGETDKQAAWERVSAETGYRKKTAHVSNRFRITAVASLIFILFIGVFLYLNQAELSRIAAGKQDRYKNDIRPGGNRATLTLAGGKKIVLDNTNQGLLTESGHLAIRQDAGGGLRYVSGGNSSAADVAYNTLTTPNGGTFSITLADGSKIWLNAGTSLRFPEVFTGRERKIELLYGEAYFEVKHEEKAPFIVKTPNGLVEDLGTHFNISAYRGAAAERTTLLEGSVRVSANRRNVTLQPGQEAAVSTGPAAAIRVAACDPADAVAWKNGLFLFNNARLESIMDEIGRWYNVRVSYGDETVKNEVFLGSISRFKNVSEVLDLLEKTGNIHFELKDNTIKVQSKQ